MPRFDIPWRGLFRWAMALSLLLATAGSAVWGITRLADPNTLPMRVVRIDGDFRYLDRKALERAVIPIVRGGFFTVNVTAVRREALKLFHPHCGGRTHARNRTSGENEIDYGETPTQIPAVHQSCILAIQREIRHELAHGAEHPAPANQGVAPQSFVRHTNRRNRHRVVRKNILETLRFPIVTGVIIAANALAWTFLQGLGTSPALPISVCQFGLIPGDLLGTAAVGTRVQN